MPLLDPVIWAKGTLLNPQHLQIQDRYLEQLLEFNMRALNFRPWGFERLSVDQEQLAAGAFVVTEAAGIMPDGLLFDMPAPDPAPALRMIADQFGPDEDTLDLFLAVPNYRERGVNVSGAKRDLETRYRADVAVFRDDNTGQTEKPVLVARKNMRVLVEGENREGHSCLRVARVKKTLAGLYELDSRFVPPLLDLNASAFLTGIARRLVEVLGAKSAALAGARRQKNQSLADFTTADVANFWLLYTMNTYYPAFRHIFDVRNGHPEFLYAQMISLAGALSTFSLKIQPRDLPVYDHDNLGGCFADLDEKLHTLLDTVVPSNFVALPLKRVDTSIYAASIDREDYLRNTRMYLAISAETPAADLIKRAPHLIKICSADYIEQLVQRALAGVPIAHVPRPPSVIPVKMNYQYFSLSQRGGAWEAIVRARNLAAYVPDDFPNPSMELLIVLENRGA